MNKYLFLKYYLTHFIISSLLTTVTIVIGYTIALPFTIMRNEDAITISIIVIILNIDSFYTLLMYLKYSEEDNELFLRYGG